MLQISAIDSSSDEGLKPDSINGMIELKNVVFRYPSREQVPVISVHFCFCFFLIHKYHFLSQIGRV